MSPGTGEYSVSHETIKSKAHDTNQHELTPLVNALTASSSPNRLMQASERVKAVYVRIHIVFVTKCS